MTKTIVAMLSLCALLLACWFWSWIPEARAGDGVETCATINGDVNGDNVLDISDPIAILGNLFAGTPPELVPACGSCLELEARVEELEDALAACRGPNPPFGVPSTGQVTCYDLVGAFPDTSGVAVDCASAVCQGQDGSYRAGIPQTGRFVDNEDGTVLDTLTGLMWQQDAEGFRGFLWCDALHYCEDLVLAGHDDWRLPNAHELASLIDYGRDDGAIDPVFSLRNAWFWSSTTSNSHPEWAFRVDFRAGPSDNPGVAIADKDNPFNTVFARAVRGP